MRTRLIVVVTILSVSGLILAAQLGAFEADEARIIPVNTAYATFQQDGLKSLDEAVDSDVLSMIQEAPPQIVLCIGSDVAAAVKASAASFSMPEDQVPAVGRGTNDTLWVAASRERGKHSARLSGSVHRGEGQDDSSRLRA